MKSPSREEIDDIIEWVRDCASDEDAAILRALSGLGPDDPSPLEESDAD